MFYDKIYWNKDRYTKLKVDYLSYIVLIRGSIDSVLTSISWSASWIDFSSLAIPASVEKSTKAKRSRLSTISLSIDLWQKRMKRSY